MSFSLLSNRDAFGYPLKFRSALVAGLLFQTSYDNRGGKGDRRSFITVTTNTNLNSDLAFIVDGNYDSGGEWAGSAVGAYLRFEFDSPKIINEMKFYMSGDMANATWKIQGSHDAVTWYDIGGEFGITEKVTTITTINENKSAYLFYQMLGTSGNLGTIHYEREMEFKINK